MNTNLRGFSQDQGLNRNWLDVLDKNNVRHMALDPNHDQKLIKALNSRPDWIIEFENDEAILYARGVTVEYS
jgi:hypothetical protein